ncbi:MAG TPA: ABC transporter ATP-binding protein [Candidatus Nitrosotenuis sp.]|nr:ABC transporter ATP-binding protein [Candidatus Nitrosotenuis sp.]
MVPGRVAPGPDGAGVRPVLEVRGLTKRYGKVVAVDELSFQLYPGDIFGFLGPNGAGKTTTLRMLATVLAPDGGDARIDGYSLRQVAEVRARVGFMPDFLGVYDDLLVREYLEFFARAYKVPSHHREYVIDEALATTRLTHLADKPVEGLSRGQKQRLGLARLLMHDPILFLLDEPAAGLDPRARVELADILKGLQKRGKTLVVSSHILSDLADFCNKVGILARGRLVRFGETRQVVSELSDTRRLRLRLLDRGEEARRFLEAYPGVITPAWHGDELGFEFRGGDRDLADLHRKLFEQGLPVVTLAEEPWDLQDVYLKLTEGIPHD